MIPTSSCVREDRREMPTNARMPSRATYFSSWIIRYIKALENAGKLYDELELVVKCKKIVGTRKRRLSHIFTFEVVKETKGKFNKKEIELELNDYQLLTELEYNEGIYAGQKVNFNQNQEIILKISQQVGQEKPDWFLRSIKKN